MDPVEYLRGLKRRWRLVAGCAAVALVAAGSMHAVFGLAGKTTYNATVTLMQSSTGTRSTEISRNSSSTGSGTSSATTIAALVTIDPVAKAVADEIKYIGDPKRLTRKITARVDPKTGFLKITATSTNLARAKQLADAFSKQLLAYLVQREAQTNASLVKALGAQIARIRSDVAALDKQIKRYPAAAAAVKSGETRSGGSGGGAGVPSTGTPADPLITQRNAALTQLSTLSNQLQEAKSRTADTDGLSIVQAATEDRGGTGVSIPSGLMPRLAIATFLGLLGGIGLALVRERFDRRIRTKESAEQYFGFPVLAEVPSVRARGLTGRLLHKTPKRPSELPPAVADAYRLLASGLNGAVGNGGSGAGPVRRGRPKAILVTSAGPGDGKMSVVSNLAATLAGAGKTVTVVSCDFRHPEINREFGIADHKSLAEILRSANGGPVLSSAMLHTPMSGVWVVPGGTARETDQLLNSTALRRLLMEARQLSDVVLIDTAPILTSDATSLLPEVDGVLVVVRAGTTKPELAERSSEYLKRLKAPVLGMVLSGHAEATLPRGYYRRRTTRQVIAGSPRAIVRGTIEAPRVIVRGAARAAKLALAPFNVAARFLRGFPRLTRRTKTQ